MRWHKRDIWKVSIVVAGMLLLLVLMIWVPMSAADAHERASGLATPGTGTVQATPTLDATITALNKEKLAQEIQQLKNQNEPNLFSWLQANAGILFSTLVVVIGALIGYYRWLEDRRNAATVAIAVKEVAQAKPADIQQIAASQLELNNAYYKGVLQQSSYSFFAAIFFAVAGMIFFFFVASNPKNPSIIGLTGGTLTEFLSAINFYLYGRASNQLETFHSRLDKLQLFVLANSICENLNEELKYETRAELVLLVTNFLAPGKTEDTLQNDRKKNARKIVAVTKPKQTNHKKAQEYKESSEEM